MCGAQSSAAPQKLHNHGGRSGGASPHASLVRAEHENHDLGQHPRDLALQRLLPGPQNTPGCLDRALFGRFHLVAIVAGTAAAQDSAPGFGFASGPDHLA